MESQINNGTNEIHSDMVKYVDTLYDRIIQDLNSQKEFLHDKLQDWKLNQNKLHQNTNLSDTILNTNDHKKLLSNIFQIHDNTTLNMNQILQEYPLQHMHEISKVTCSMIKAQIQQKCNDINRNNPISQAISDDIAHKYSNIDKINITDIHESNIDQYGLDSNYNFDSILSQCTPDHITCVYDNIKLYFYQARWKSVGYKAGRLTLYHIKPSNLQYLMFSNIDNNRTLSFQPIDISNCDIKAQQQQPKCVNWVASDWCKKGTHYPFCAIFPNNNNVMEFINYCNQSKIEDDDSKQITFVETAPTIKQEQPSLKMDSLPQELALKKVYINEQNKWRKLCAESTIKIYKDKNNNDKKTILITHNNSKMIHHIVPNMKTANFDRGNSKLYCQWHTEEEDSIQKTALVVGVYFETKQSFDCFIKLFPTVSQEKWIW